MKEKYLKEIYEIISSTGVQTVPFTTFLARNIQKTEKELEKELLLFRKMNNKQT